MISQLFLGAVITCVTVIITASAISIASTMVDRMESRLNYRSPLLRVTISLSAVVLWMMAAVYVAIVIWAFVFLWLGQFVSLEASFYFSIVSFTTLGFGDGVIAEEWRILSGVTAANGFILFSLITAFLIESLLDFKRPRG